MSSPAKTIIGLTGGMGSGKTTISKHMGGTVISFATPLKKMLAALGLTYEQLYGSEKGIPLDLLGGRTPREAMQSLGTEWGRRLVADELWLFAWKKAMDESPHDLIICDDVRFPNEVEFLRSLGGEVVALVRPGLKTFSAHISEQLDFIQHKVKIISNDDTPEKVALKVRSALTS